MSLPGRCMGCGAAVEWRTRAWRSQNRTGRWHFHVCPKDRPTCGAFMTHARERCARSVGHGGYHRSRYAMDNAREARTGRRRAA